MMMMVMMTMTSSFSIAVIRPLVPMLLTRLASPLPCLSWKYGEDNRTDLALLLLSELEKAEAEEGVETVAPCGVGKKTPSERSRCCCCC